LFFEKKSVGEIMSLSSNDLAAVQLSCGMGLVAAMDAVLMTSAALIFMAYISPALTLIAVLPMPLLAILTRLLSGRLHHRFAKVQEQFARLTEFARSSIVNIRLLKTFVREHSQLRTFDTLGRQYVRNNLRLAAVQGTLFPVSGMIGNVSLLLVLYSGGRLTVQGAITIGDFVAFIAYLFMLTWPMMAIGWVANLFQRGVTSLDRLARVGEAVSTIQEGAKPVFFKNGRGDIEIRNLSFAYSEQEANVLTSISLHIPAGSFFGMVGPTGAGKSTFCQLLTRFYPVPDNRLFLDGIDANRAAIASFRDQFAYVPQETILFSDSIAANIGFGNPHASREEIMEAARLSAIHDEIVALPQGYETRIGEKGVKLSGGQRQRLSLARALLLHRPVLVIDDGLSAVDIETEQRIVQNLATNLQGRTVFIVSHRLAPLKDAEQIVVLEGGRITDQGNPEHLLATSGYYQTIYKQQAKSHLEEG
jgi:ATP-binding cassette subfamily B protein